MTDESRAEWIAEALARYEAPLLRFATKLLRDGDRARDVVQETFLQLCQQDRTGVEGHLAAWLFRVCRNRAFDLRRKESRVESIAEATPVADPHPDPSQAVQQKQEGSAVLRILETLPEAHQEAVYLRFQSGLSYKEIAEITGHTVTNVGVILHTAVKKIRAQMDSAPRIQPRTAEGSR
jgi:RNA polymerase sigma-70 factor (ECF subfamily)